MTLLSAPGAVPSGGAAGPLPSWPGPAVGRGQPRQLYVGAWLVGAAGLLAVGAHLTGGSTRLMLALVAALAGLTSLGASIRRFGLFSVGGITWAMVAVLFIGRWFSPPVSGLLLTPLAASYYDRDGALVASAVMILVFAVTYAVGSRPLLLGPGPRPAVMRRTTSTTVVDLALVGCILIALRALTGVFLQIGIPGRAPVAVPFVGVIYYLSSYGPLVVASLMLWYGRNSRSSNVAAAGLLAGWALIEGALGSHGSTFQAVLVFGGTKAMMGNPLRLRSVRTLAVAALVCGAVAASLFLAFIARQPLNGGARPAIGDVPAFVFNRLGGLDYIAPVVGAVDQTGPDLSRLRPTTWDRYVRADVYGLPEEALTAFASTAVGWWYGLGALKGVVVGAAICGLLAGQFDQWCRRYRSVRSANPPTFVVGVLLGWATFLLGGTIGSLGGISIGFTGVAFVIERVHRVVAVGLSRRSGASRPAARPVRHVPREA